MIIHSYRSVPNVRYIPQVAERIAEAVGAISAHWDEVTAGKRSEDPIGTEAAFNPHDEKTKELFGNLWEYAFPKKPYDPQTQQAIIRALKREYPVVLPMMREIGYHSEREMEKGYARAALEKMKDYDPLPEAIQKASENYRMARFVTSDKSKEELEAEAIKARDEKIKRFKEITRDFPYPTYESMSHQESLMVKMLEPSTIGGDRGLPYLIVEGGALPFSAIYNSLSRFDREVIITNKDRSTHEIASQFIARLEEMGVLRKGIVKAIHADMRNPDTLIPGIDGISPYAALISQRVLGAKDISQIAENLTSQHIDTILTRGAHGMVELLYEPVDNQFLDQLLGHRLSTVPTHSMPNERDGITGEGLLIPQHFCYNTTRMFSECSLYDDWKEMAGAMGTMFSDAIDPPSQIRSL